MLPPAPDSVASAVEDVLKDQYARWRAFPPNAPTICDAEQDVACFGPDIDGSCNHRRCRSREEMGAFLDRLVTLARRYPDSPLPFAHAIYAAVKLGFPAVARSLLDSCEPRADWWCELGAGYAHQRGGRPADGERRFRRALETMPSELRCSLEDAVLLVPDERQEDYQQIPCELRAETHRKFWWLADPFLLDDTNDRWSEHLARGFEGMLSEDIRVRIASRTILPLGYSAGLIRFGFLDSTDRRITGRQLGVYWKSRSAAFNHFIPNNLARLDTLPDKLDYQLIPDFPPSRNVERYTRAEGFVYPVSAQVARFRDDRSDSLVVAVASHVGSLPVESSGQTHFVASERPGHAVTLDPSPLRETVRFMGRVANRKQIVGVEVFTAGADGRHRRMLHPLASADRTLSDVLLFGPVGQTLPERRIQAVGLMHGSVTVQRFTDLGVYWEAYGLPNGEEIEVSIRLKKEGGGWLSGLIGALGVGGGQERASVSWRETGEGEAPFARAMTLDLEDLDEGAYELTVEMRLGGGGTLTRTRRFEVVEGPE